MGGRPRNPVSYKRRTPQQLGRRSRRWTRARPFPVTTRVSPSTTTRPTTINCGFETRRIFSLFYPHPSRPPTSSSASLPSSSAFPFSFPSPGPFSLLQTSRHPPPPSTPAASPYYSRVARAHSMPGMREEKHRLICIHDARVQTYYYFFKPLINLIFSPSLATCLC